MTLKLLAVLLKAAGPQAATPGEKGLEPEYNSIF